jgi:hypothetical protein
MFKLDSAEALRAAFRPKDRDALDLDPALSFPLLVRHYLAWRQPSGAYVYLLFAIPGGAPTGIAFETNGGAGSVPQMCDWCHGTGTQVALLVAKVSGLKRVGVHVCADLTCREKLEDAANRSGRSVLPELERLVERMGRFASEALKMDLTGLRR